MVKEIMKNIIVLSFSLLILFNSFALAQQEKSDFGISLSGFVKTDLIFDSRQTVSLREGHFLLYPANESLDNNKVDINEKANFNILSIQTRLTGKITGPDAFGAKTSGMIEGEFFGTSDGDVNGFRLRHAYTKLDWENTSVLVGQTWHPMFVTDVFPGVVSFNTGAPFQPFSRNPQLRITQSFGDLKVIAVAATQRDFQSFGPNSKDESVQSFTYLRNSVIPNLHLQFQYKAEDHIFGAGADFKRLTPRLATTKNIKTAEAINSLSAIGYMKLNLSPFTIKAEGVYGNNLVDMLMLGGYAVKSLDTLTGFETYTNLSCYSVWGELVYGKELEFAVFGGYSQYLGAKNNIDKKYYSRINNIDNLIRISPRIQWNSGKTRLSTELEYTAAAYGVPKDNNKGLVEQTKLITNLRLLLAVYYFF
jgi:hypothetical protein